MGIFFKKKSADKLMLVFSIGSSSVGGTFFLAQNSGIPKIIFSTTEPIHLEEKVDIDRFLALTINSLEIVVGRAYKAGLGLPEEVFCVLSSPWYVSQTRIINFKKNTPFIFTSKLAEGLVEKEVKLFEEEQSKKHGNVRNLNRIIELKNIKTLLNGYETYKPFNQETKELEMISFVSVGEEQILKKIEDAIGKCFHFSKIRFSSFALSFFTVVRDMHIQQENFLLLDIGGEITDIAMVKNNIMRESISFPLGRNFLIRGVSSGLGCTLSEADSLISLFKDGHAEKSVVEKITGVMDQIKTKWLKNFQESLASLSNDISIPSVIYMNTDKNFADFFCQTIKTEQFNQYTLTESKFQIIFLDAKEFHGIATFEEPIHDSGIVVNSIYINRFLTKI